MASYLSQQRYLSFLFGGTAGAYLYISTKVGAGFGQATDNLSTLLTGGISLCLKRLVWKRSQNIAAALPGVTISKSPISEVSAVFECLPPPP